MSPSTKTELEFILLTICLTVILLVVTGAIR